MQKQIITFITILIMILIGTTSMQAKQENIFILKEAKAVRQDFQDFNTLMGKDWNCVFDDDLTDNWQDKWFKDGLISTATNSKDGLLVSTDGENHPNSYAVMWTKKEFSGDIRIEYDFTRYDKNFVGVNIIYFLATGMGVAPYDEDILKWQKLRDIPHMHLYFNLMNTYHISYAANGVINDPDQAEYIRLRRYIPKGNTTNSLENTDVDPTYYANGDFLPFALTHIVIIKYQDMVYMELTTENSKKLYSWNTSTVPNLEKGRIGLRLMAQRRSLFKNFKVYELK